MKKSWVIKMLDDQTNKNQDSNKNNFQNNSVLDTFN